MVEPGKLFVGGLNTSTTQESMYAYFSQFGPCECSVVMDRESGKSKGFGFVQYQGQGVAEALLARCPHQVDGKQVDVKQCMAKGHAPPPRASVKGTGKGGMQGAMVQGAMVQAAMVPGMVGGGAWTGGGGGGPLKTQGVLGVLPADFRISLNGLGPQMTEDDLTIYFMQFGPCECHVLMEGNTPTGSGFVTFVDDQTYQTVMATPVHQIEGHQVAVKKYEPPPQQAPQQFNGFAKGKAGGKGKGVGGSPNAILRPDGFEACKMFIGGLPAGCDLELLKAFCGQFGTLTDLNIPLDTATGQSKGIAFAVFETDAAVDLAIANTESNYIGDKWLDVKRSYPRPPKGDGKGKGGGQMPGMGMMGKGKSVLPQIQAGGGQMAGGGQRFAPY